MNLFKAIISHLKAAKLMYSSAYNKIKAQDTSRYGQAFLSTTVEEPELITCPELLHCEEYVKLRKGFYFISPGSRLYIKKFTTLAPYVTVVTGNHIASVSIPQNLLGQAHINDKEKDMHIGSDVWIGTRATLVYGAEISRGAIVGACSLVNKYVPPYAIVAGVPAKIIGCKFSKEQIIEHEKWLYSEDERMSEEELDKLFFEYFEGKKVIGTSHLTKEDAQKRDEYFFKMKLK